MDTLPPHTSGSKPYTVYVLVDPRDYTVRYVGITDNVYRRFWQHVNLESANQAKNMWIEELKQENIMLIMKTLEVVETEEMAREREKHWIHHHRFLGAVLYNQQIPTIRIDSTPRPKRPPVSEKPRGDRVYTGRKHNYSQIRELVLYRYEKKHWADSLSRDMQQEYEFNYFVRPKRNETTNPKKYARHQRSYERGRQWIREYEENKLAPEDDGADPPDTIA